MWATSTFAIPRPDYTLACFFDFESFHQPRAKGTREEPSAKRAKKDQNQESQAPHSGDLEASKGEDKGPECSTSREQPPSQTTNAQAYPDGNGTSQPGPACNTSLSSTLEDLHVYLAKQDELIRKLEKRCGAAEVKQDKQDSLIEKRERRRAGAEAWKDLQIQELEKRCAATEEASRHRIGDLQLQVNGLTLELAALKQHGTTPASAPGLATFLKRKRDEE